MKARDAAVVSCGRRLGRRGRRTDQRRNAWAKRDVRRGHVDVQARRELVTGMAGREVCCCKGWPLELLWRPAKLLPGRTAPSPVLLVVLRMRREPSLPKEAWPTSRMYERTLRSHAYTSNPWSASAVFRPVLVPLWTSVVGPARPALCRLPAWEPLAHVPPTPASWKSPFPASTTPLLLHVTGTVVRVAWRSWVGVCLRACMVRVRGMLLLTRKSEGQGRVVNQLTHGPGARGSASPDGGWRLVRVGVV